MLADPKAKEGDPAKAQELYEQAADVVDTLRSTDCPIRSSLIGRRSFWGATPIPVTTACLSFKKSLSFPYRPTW